jgi:hypothetical protein
MWPPDALRRLEEVIATVQMDFRLLQEVLETKQLVVPLSEEDHAIDQLESIQVFSQVLQTAQSDAEQLSWVELITVHLVQEISWQGVWPTPPVVDTPEFLVDALIPHLVIIHLLVVEQETVPLITFQPLCQDLGIKPWFLHQRWAEDMTIPHRDVIRQLPAEVLTGQVGFHQSSPVVFAIVHLNAGLRSKGEDLTVPRASTHQSWVDVGI